MKRARLFRRAKDTRTVINLNAGHQTDVNVHPLEEIEESTKKSRKKRIDLPPEPDRDDYSCESKSKNKLKFENISKNLCKDENPKVLAKKTRAKVDLDSMKEELKQLEDPPETDLEKEISVNRLNYEFYDTPCEELAQNLLGKILVRRLDNGIVLKGRIVETESYLGEIDAASHTFNNRVTPRNIPMYMLPGTIYVYMTYGMYYCFNISSGGKGAAVLLRALEPLENTEEMQNNRLSLLKSKRTKDFRTHELCNGPSKLCTAFRINKDSCKYSLCTWKKMWIEEDPGYPREDIKIIKTSRIGIESVGAEWSKKPLRFYIYGNSSVSKRDKKSEDNLIIDNT